MILSKNVFKFTALLRTRISMRLDDQLEVWAERSKLPQRGLGRRPETQKLSLKSVLIGKKRAHFVNKIYICPFFQFDTHDITKSGGTKNLSKLFLLPLPPFVGWI